MCHRDFGEAGVSLEVIGMLQPFWELVAYKAKAFGKAGWVCNCGGSGCLGSVCRGFCGVFAQQIAAKASRMPEGHRRVRGRLKEAARKKINYFIVRLGFASLGGRCWFVWL